MLMLRFLFKPLLLLTLLLALPGWLIRPQPFDDSALREFLLPPDCPAPCFMGVRPGTTTMDEAFDLLRSHPWVDTISLENFETDVRSRFLWAWLNWTWTETRPDPIDAASRGQMGFTHMYSGEIVDTIELETHFPTYEVQHWFGKPDVTSVRLEEDHSLVYSEMYFSGRWDRLVIVSTHIPCPANLLHYWRSEAKIIITSWERIEGETGHSLKEALRLC